MANLTLVVKRPEFKAPNLLEVLKRQAEFMLAYNVPRTMSTTNLYISLIEEEHEEWVEEYYGANTFEFDELKELTDLLYVTAGLYFQKFCNDETTYDVKALKYNLPHEQTWDFAISKFVEDVSLGKTDRKTLLQLMYSIYAYAEAMEYPIEEAYRRVHISNMSKLDKDGKPIRREDGKVLKSDLYKPAFLEDLTNGR